MHVDHSLKPILFSDSEILILGTMPSVKSREYNKYYGHPQNRFWKVLESIFEDKVEDTETFCKRHKLALYDVLESCDIQGSSDSSIKNPVPARISDFIDNSHIRVIFLTGKKALQLFEKYQSHITVPYYGLPSTSPANARTSFENLVEAYKIIKTI